MIMNLSVVFKSVLSVLIVAAMSSSANAAVWSIQGRLDGTTNTASTLVLTPYGSPWVTETVAAAQAGAIRPTVTGILDISGGVISGGSITVAAYGVKTFLGDFYGTAMDTSVASYVFGTTGVALNGGSVVVGSCQGTLVAAICPSAYAGSPILDYQLTDLGFIGGSPTWDLNLRFGTTNPNITGGLTVMSFTLCSPNLDTATCLTPPLETPAPAAAWLFGSSLIGLARLARRKTVTIKDNVA
jgi:hypothetical protein